MPVDDTYDDLLGGRVLRQTVVGRHPVISSLADFPSGNVLLLYGDDNFRIALLWYMNVGELAAPLGQGGPSYGRPDDHEGKDGNRAENYRFSGHGARAHLLITGSTVGVAWT